MRIVSLLLFLPVLAAQAQVIAIRGARVVDGTGAPARQATVIVRNGRIEAIAEDAPIPADARIVEAPNQTLIPGLFDVHTHLSASPLSGAAADWGKNLQAYLTHGVTTVNDFSAFGEMFAPMRRLLANGTPRGPHVQFASRISTPAGHGTEGGWGDFFTQIASTPEQAHADMKTMLAYKPDVIKIFTDGWRYGFSPNLTSMNLETAAAIVEDAHAAGIKALSHTVTLEGAKIAARAGVDVLAHGIGDAMADSELISILKEKKTFYASTLAVYESKPSTRPSEARKHRWECLTGNIRRLHDAGIPLAVGTDAGMPNTLHGAATLRELELLVAAGLTPLEAIAAGTSVSAKSLGLDADRGVIAPGMRADLVLIDGRPDERIQDIEKTARVFLNGVEIEPQDIKTIPLRDVPAKIDDMERADGRTLRGTLRVNATDSGTDHSTMLFLAVPRGPRDHALMIEARMAAKEHPYARLEIPLTPGSVEPADVSRYQGVSFDARGAGGFRLIFGAAGARTGRSPAAEFNASDEWQTIRVPFENKLLRSLFFELTGPPGSGIWLELDNVQFYSK